MAQDSIAELDARLLEFAQARDWEQFQSPKNLSMALAGEVGELLEHFQWLTEQQSYELTPEKHDDAALELADIFIYLIRLANRMNIDLIEVANRKCTINESRYPAEIVKGSAKRAEDYARDDIKD